MRRGMAVLLGSILLLGGPAAALSTGTVSGLLVRVQGDVVVGGEESADLVVVVSGDAEVQGRAGVLVVIGGTARLSDARVGRLIVVRGAADLSGTATVLGDVWLASARIGQSPASTVGGSVRQLFGNTTWPWLLTEPALAVGLLGVMLAVGWLTVAAGAGTMRRAADALTSNAAGSLGAGLLFFVVGPALALLLFFTVLGVPLSLVYLVVAWPAMGLLGWGVAALRLGGWLLPSGTARPYPAVLTGTLVLAAAGLIPFAGQLLVPAACALGGGALVTAARSRYREEGGGGAVPVGGSGRGPVAG